MDQNSLKRSFPVILKDEDTGDRVMLTEDGQERLPEDEDDDEMHHAPEFDLPQDVEEPEDEMHDAEESEIEKPEQMESVDDVMDWLFEDEEDDEIRGAVEEEAADPLERWVAPTIEEENQDSLQLSETEVRNVIQQEIQRLLG